MRSLCTLGLRAHGVTTPYASPMSFIFLFFRDFLCSMSQYCTETFLWRSGLISWGSLARVNRVRNIVSTFSLRLAEISKYAHVSSPARSWSISSCCTSRWNSRSPLFPQITRGTSMFSLILFFRHDLVSKICRLSRWTSWKESRLSRLKTRMKTSPGGKGETLCLVLSAWKICKFYDKRASSLTFKNKKKWMLFHVPVRMDSLLMAGNGWFPDVSSMSSW